MLIKMVYEMSRSEMTDLSVKKQVYGNWRISGSATAVLSDFRADKPTKIVSQWNQKEFAINIKEPRISPFMLMFWFSISTLRVITLCFLFYLSVGIVGSSASEWFLTTHIRGHCSWLKLLVEARTNGYSS